MMNTTNFFSSYSALDPLYIAEISSNHNQDLDRAIALIAAAHKSGAQAIKFQLFEIEHLFSSEVLKTSPAHRARKHWELPRNFVHTLSLYSRSLGMLFGCTPFDLSAVPFLTPHVDFFKVASYELLWNDLIRACGSTGKPVILSTGMATEREVLESLEVLKDSGCKDSAVLHCVSSYPAPREETNLSVIRTLRDKLQLPVGWSDHTHDSSVVLRAINRWGASVVELHFDLDGEGFEAGGGHCWLPNELSRMIKEHRSGLLLDGNGIKVPTASEQPDVNWRADPSDGLRPLKRIRSDIVA